MKNIVLFSILGLFFFSCISIRFPEKVQIDITVPENLDMEKVQVIIDTLRGLNKNDKNKLNGTIEFLIHKVENKDEQKGKEQKGMTAPKRN
tara:strand:- start:403 stop:675 length:273 start_codon:yes stop_codon:yes gene_type:complete